MKAPVCHIPTREDRIIAMRLGWDPSKEKEEENKRNGRFTPREIATLRGVYDTYNDTPLLPDEFFEEKDLSEMSKEEKAKYRRERAETIAKAAATLNQFWEGVRRTNRKRLENKDKRLDQCYDVLRHAYTWKERRSRINAISGTFSAVVDNIMRTTGIDRQAIVNGFAANGEYYGGEAYILDKVYRQIMAYRRSAFEAVQHPKEAFDEAKSHNYLNYHNAPKTVEEYKELCQHRFEEYSKMLELWDELLPFVLKDLVKKEGIIFGVKKEYSALAVNNSYDMAELEAKWNIAESVRDGWYLNYDMESGFGSIGQQVRRFISTVPSLVAVPHRDPETGEITHTTYVQEKDDLGWVVCMDPTTVHQYLTEFFKGIQTSEDMFKRLASEEDRNKAKVEWMRPLLEMLNKNPQMVTKFFVDFKKNFQPYSVMYEDPKQSDGFLHYFKTKILNRGVNLLKSKYVLAISAKGRISDNALRWGVPVFRDSQDGKPGTVDWARLAELRKKVLKWTAESQEEDQTQNAAGPGVFGDLKKYDNTKKPKVKASLLTTRDRNATIKEDGKTKRITFEMRRNFLMEVFCSLGFDVTPDAVEEILRSSAIYDVRDRLEKLFDPKGNSGLMYVLTGSIRSDFGILAASNKTKEEKEKALMRLEHAEKSFQKTIYDKMIPKTRKDGRNEKTYPFREHCNKLLEIISSKQDSFKIESRTRYQGNTMYSFVAPSFLGDRLEAIESYVKDNDKEGLLNFLKKSYLDSTFFVDSEYIETDGKKGEIFNMWLKEIVDACKDKETPLDQSVASIFSYERDLGKTDKKFEDFTLREHGIDMMVHFFADEQQKKGYGGKGTRDLNKKLSALFPVFVLGDANVSKYIRAPRITTPIRVNKKNGKPLPDTDTKTDWEVGYTFDDNAEEKILDQFWNIYMQEKNRMEMDKQLGLTLYANGKKVKHDEGEFSILTFLNPKAKEYNEKYKIPEGKEYDKATVKSKIKQYLDDAAISENGIEHIETLQDGSTRKVITPSFLKRLENSGVMELTGKEGENKQNTKRKYRYLSSVATPENIKEKVREFYWNTKLATALQLQVVTIDPSFYHGSKDLQKRYKEAHAPGTVLDIYAKDFDGNPYCTPNKDGDVMETFMYFDDLAYSSEDYNPAFMERILRNFAKADTQTVDDAIANGILTPKHDEREEEQRQDDLKTLLGNKYSIYRNFCENTLTDGQGLRTLTSFRKVLGMAGRWTWEMEQAYKGIMAIRAKHAIRNDEDRIIDYSDLTDDELKEIARYSAVFQAIKPYMFSHEKVKCTVYKKDDNGEIVKDEKGNPVTIETYKYIPVQHKYAEAVIIPELLPKGNKLRDLGLWMDEHNVDMIGSTKIAKVGCFGAANLKDVHNLKSLHGALEKGVIHELPYQHYRIQTNVPMHLDATQLFGTQIRKLIMAGLKMNDNHYQSYFEDLGIDTLNLSTNGDGENTKAPITGKNLLALFNSLICCNIMDSYDKFKNNATNINALSELLQQSTVSSMRESMDNILSYVVTGDERFLIPLFEGGLEHDSAALILSTFKKAVNKQQISGGSAVQVSAFGIDGYKEDGGLRFVTDPENNKNILYAEIEMPFDRSYTLEIKNPNGTVTKKKVNLSFDTYCNRDGTLKPVGEAIPKMVDGKINREWKKYQSYTYKKIDGKLVPCDYDDPEAQVYKPLIEKDYPDILSILAYRIPTERDYSMLNCRIKRFTSRMAGGTIKVPLEGTTIAGFDFDIDKLYFMQRDYRKHVKDHYYTEENYGEAAKNIIWAAFYKENKKVQAALEDARREAEIANPNKLLGSEPIYENGKLVGYKTVHLSTLNSYWEAANIEERFGISKNDAFIGTAVAKGKEPTKKELKGKSKVWMEEYDFSKSPDQNTRTARNNLLITLMQQRLMDQETVEQRYTPGGFANASEAALMTRILHHGDLSQFTDSNGKIVWESTDKNKKSVEEYVKRVRDKKDPLEDPEPNYDPTDPFTILWYNQQNQVAGKLVGIFANHNTNHAFASLMSTFKLKEPIKFCGHEYSDLLHKDDPNLAAQAELNVAEFLAASVDAVKDPTLNFIYLNLATADAGALLGRLGFTATEIGLLFNQAIIKQVCEEAADRGVRVKTVISEARQHLLEQYLGTSPKTVDLTVEALAQSIVDERRTIEKGDTSRDFVENANNVDLQLTVLNLFDQILKTSEDVSGFVMNTKFTASNAVSSTFGGLYAQQLRVKEYLDRFEDSSELSYEMVVAEGTEGAGLFSKPIDNDPKYINMDKSEYLRQIRFNPFAFEQAMFDCNRKMLKDLARYYPYETELYKGVRGRMQELAQYGTLSEDDINDIHSNIPVALLAKQEHSLFNGERAYVDKNGVQTNWTNREYYRTHFASDLADMLADDPNELGSLPIFSYLCPERKFVGKNEDREIWTISLQDVGGMGPEIKEAVKESWSSLMEMNDDGSYKNPKWATLGRDLFVYCFYQLGFDFSPMSFMHLAPTAVKDNIKIEGVESEAFERAKILPLQGTNDVLVYPKGNERYLLHAQMWGATGVSVNTLEDNNTYQTSEVLDLDAVKELVRTAKSRPELTFHMMAEISQEEFDLFAYDVLGEDVPANILFSGDTLNSVSPESKYAIHYGSTRTYRQFLDDILQGREASINTDEFAQMFILNHLDNSRFVYDTNKGNKSVEKIINESTNNKKDLLNEKMEYEDSFTLDVSKFVEGTNEAERDAAKKFVSIRKNDKGEIIEAKWCPCIKIDDSYYMPASGNDKFNVNTGLNIKYVKVVPWGSSKTLRYDVNEIVPPSMRYQTSMTAVDERNYDYRNAVVVEDTTDGETPTSKLPSIDELSELSKEDLLQILIDDYREKLSEDPKLKAEDIEDRVDLFRTDNSISTSEELRKKVEKLIKEENKEIEESESEYPSKEEILKYNRETLIFILSNEYRKKLKDDDVYGMSIDTKVQLHQFNVLNKKTDDELRQMALNLIDAQDQAVAIPETAPVGSGTTSNEPEGEKDNNILPKTNDRRQLEGRMFGAFVLAIEKKFGRMEMEEKQKLRMNLRNKTNEEFDAMVKEIRQACVKDGVLMMDDQGNVMKGC